MARIRSVHPGLWTDEQFVSLSMPARLLFIGIWNEADDRGAFEWKPLTLKMRLMAADDVDVSALLEELEHARVVSSYEVEGKRYGLVRNFTKFQRPKKPTYVHPVPGDSATSSPPVPHQTETAPEKSPQMEEEGEGVGKEEGEGKGSESAPASPSLPPPSSRGSRLPEDWDPSPDLLAWAAQTLPGFDTGPPTENFRDYWIAVPGAKGRKADWDATWRKWMRTEYDKWVFRLPAGNVSKLDFSRV